jgi:hypothetical protein
MITPDIQNRIVAFFPPPPKKNKKNKTKTKKKTNKQKKKQPCKCIMCEKKKMNEKQD